VKHPRDILLGSQAASSVLPVCDHYSGVEMRMRKSLQLQAEMTQEFGTCVFDVTLDCEDGAPVGGEAEHAALVTELALSAAPKARVAVRVPTQQQAQHVAQEVEALYTNGPAGGGGATRTVREVIAAAAVLMPRESVHTTTVLLNAEGH
jgi:citrate lyase subunit beta/citryl-CoA lyase